MRADNIANIFNLTKNSSLKISDGKFEFGPFLFLS